MSKPKEIVFLASLPDIQSAITFLGGKGNGARIRLELPASEQDAALLLAHHGRGRLLEVTIKIADEEEIKQTVAEGTTRIPSRIDLRRSGNRRNKQKG